MPLPDALQRAIAAAVGSPIAASAPVGGGDINAAARATLRDGRDVLVKWNARPLPRMFEVEARGLALLRQAGTLRLPEVYAQAEASDVCPAFIVMEWLGRGGREAGAAAALGEGLAALHRVTGPGYGLDHDNYIGANPQLNQPPAGPAGTWVDFYRQRRLGYQMELAAQRGRLPRQRAERLEWLLARLDELLPADPPASLLHGDLWGGNWLVAADGRPALIDPAVYYGHREAELAFTELFGGFPPAFYAAYNAAWPLEPGYDERRDIYNLYHLLNHLNLFGESYGGSVDRILRRYGQQVAGSR